MIPEQEATVPHEVILADVEPEMPQPHLYHELMMDDLDDLDDDKAALTWTSGFPNMGVMIEIESSSLSLRFRFKDKFLEFA
jgi:hypothetical protein